MKSVVFPVKKTVEFLESIATGWFTEDCKLVVTCKMQNRNATDKLNQQCSKLALLSYSNCVSKQC